MFYRGYEIHSFKGFSLIELMVVLAIVSLLSIVALPTYMSYGLGVKRLEARVALLEAFCEMEKYKLFSGQGYNGASLALLGLSDKTQQGWYQLNFEKLEQDDFVLTARPTFTDKGCTQLSCNAQGEKTYQGNGSYVDCWGE